MLYNKAKYFPRSRPWENFRPQTVRASRCIHHRAAAGDLGERTAIINLPRGGMVGASYKRAKRARTRREALSARRPQSHPQRTERAPSPPTPGGTGGARAARARDEAHSSGAQRQPQGTDRGAGRGAASYTAVPTQRRLPPSSGAPHGDARRSGGRPRESKGIRRVSRVRPERAQRASPRAAERAPRRRGAVVRTPSEPFSAHP